MSYRTIALASCLLMVGCGGAPPPPAGAPPPASTVREPPASGGPGMAGSARPRDEAKPGAPPPPPITTPGSPPVEGGTSVGQGAGGDGKGSVGQAVVEVREPLAGKLTPEDIRRILEKHGDLFGDCYTLGAGGKLKDYKAAITLKATIGPSGDINQVLVTKSTTKNIKVDACVSESLRKIKFQPPKDGATTVILFPVTFNGIEQIQ